MATGVSVATGPSQVSRDVDGKNWYWRKKGFLEQQQGQKQRAPTLDEVAENRSVRYIDARTWPGGGLEFWNLDTNGFCCFEPPLGTSVDFFDRERTIAEYGPQLIQKVKRLTGATNGYFYYYLVRGPEGVWKRFSNYIHADFGATAVPKWREELVDRFGVQKEEAQRCDICMVNVWHPVGRPAFKNPLCLLDFSSLEDYKNDAVPIPFNTVNLFYTAEQNKDRPPKEFGAALTRKTTGEKGQKVAESLLVGPTYSPKHRWIFCSDMEPTEAWAFKQYDTRPGVALCAFHNSFPDPFHAEEASCPERLSAEFRILLTFPKEASSTEASSSCSKL